MINYVKSGVQFLSYKALYRQWRPKLFSDVVGQDHITTTLRNQLKYNRVAHAYLFCGSRGTGKTSTAQIFARTINCQHPKEGEACETCEVCVKLAAGNSLDILEIDAASNNGVDEIRDLREKVKFPPSVGKYRVYIIDEVHMLSSGAFNALLKTLEEPPAHVVFILATTEPQKLPATILSRCQRFDFHRISLKVIIKRLQEVAQSTGVIFEDEALRVIARSAEGGMRDALSLMDQCISFCGNHIKYSDVIKVLGTVDFQFLFATADALLSGDTQSALQLVDSLMDQGGDITVFVKDLTGHFRNLMLLFVSEEGEFFLDLTAEQLVEYKDQCKKANRERLIRIMDALILLEHDLKWSSQPRTHIETTFIKLCRPEGDFSIDALLDRMQQLETQLEAWVQKGMIYKESSPKESSPLPVPVILEAVISPVATLPAAPKTVKPSEEKRDFLQAWPDILKLIKKEKISLYSFIYEAKPFMLKESVWGISFDETEAIYIAALEKEDNRKFLQAIIKRVTGDDIQLKPMVGKPPSQDKSNVVVQPVEDAGKALVEKVTALFGKEYVEIVDEGPEE